MLFNSLAYVLFLPAVLLVVAALPVRARNGFLLAASYFFYGCWDARFCLLLLGVTAWDYLCARQIHATEDRAARKRWLWASVTGGLVVLGFFKYFGFFVGSAVALLDRMGVDASGPALKVVLPVGISFFTFQSMSYTIDVYRRRVAPARTFLDYALYVSFFPQLVAGPIERAKDLLPQVLGARRATADDVSEGLVLIAWGMVKKVVFADNMGIRVDRIFASGDVDGATVLAGLFFFAVQIYADFSGYTDIARGSARLLGFRLSLNFEQPYFSRTPAEFWNRWHISLSSWLRDYLFVPLGGVSPFPRRVAFATLATMGLAGLWHGAAWNFVLWGLYHGALLVGYQVWRRHRPAAASRWGVAHPVLSGTLSAVLLFAFVLYGMLLFRATSFGQIAAFTAALWGGGDWVATGKDVARAVPYFVPLLAWDAVACARKRECWVLALPLWCQVLFFVAAYYACITLGILQSERFIYFEF